MKTVLLLQREQVIVCQTRLFGNGGHTRFANSDVGIEDFRQYLRQHGGAGFIVLLDPGDEQYYWQEIPRMKRRDQRAVLGNQRKKLFGNSLYASSIVEDQQSNTDTRVGVAHTGLPVDAKACVWLAELDRAGSYVRSYHWMSLLVYHCVNACIKPTVASASAPVASAVALTIAIVRLDSSDDRVMAFRGSLPLICRRVSFRSPGAVEQESAGTALVDHLQQTLSYLANLADTAVGVVTTESTTSGSAIRVVVAGGFSSAETDAIQSHCNEAGDLNVTLVPASTLVNQLSKKETASGSVTEQLMRSVIQRRAFTYSLILRGARYVQRTVRHVLYATSVSFLFGAVAVSAASRHIGNELQSLTFLATSMEEQSSQLRHAYRHPEWSSQYSVDAVRESIGHVRAVEAAIDEVAPLYFVVSVSEQLTQYPEIDLLSVSWNRDDAALYGNSGARRNGQRELHADFKDAPVGGGDFNAIVTGIVKMDAQGEASAMSRFRAFVGSIRKSAKKTAPGASVTVISLPFTESGSTAHGGGSGNGEFRLEVTSRQAAP